MRTASTAKARIWIPFKRAQRQNSAVDFGLSSKTSDSEEKFSVSSVYGEHNIDVPVKEVVEHPPQSPMANIFSCDEIDFSAPMGSCESPFGTAIENDFEGSSFDGAKYEVGYQFTRSSQLNSFKVPVEELASTFAEMTSVSKQNAISPGDFDIVEDYDDSHFPPLDEHDTENALQDVTSFFVRSKECKVQNSQSSKRMVKVATPLTVTTTVVQGSAARPKSMKSDNEVSSTKGGPFRSRLRNALQPKSPHCGAVVPAPSSVTMKEEPEKCPGDNLFQLASCNQPIQKTSERSKKLWSRKGTPRHSQSGKLTPEAQSPAESEHFDGSNKVDTMQDHIKLSSRSSPYIVYSKSLCHEDVYGRDLQRAKSYAGNSSTRNSMDHNEGQVLKHAKIEHKQTEKERTLPDSQTENTTRLSINSSNDAPEAKLNSLSSISFPSSSESKLSVKDNGTEPSKHSKSMLSGQTPTPVEVEEAGSMKNIVVGCDEEDISTREGKALTENNESTVSHSESYGSLLQPDHDDNSEHQKLGIATTSTFAQPEDINLAVNSTLSEIDFSKTWHSETAQDPPKDENKPTKEMKKTRARRKYFAGLNKKHGFSFGRSFSSKTFDAVDNTSEIPLVEWFEDNASVIDPSETINVEEIPVHLMKKATCQKGSIVQKARHFFDPAVPEESQKSNFIIWDGEETEVEVVAMQACPELQTGSDSVKETGEISTRKFAKPLRFLRKTTNNLLKARNSEDELRGERVSLAGEESGKERPPKASSSQDPQQIRFNTTRAPGPGPGHSFASSPVFTNSYSDISASSSSDAEFSCSTGSYSDATFSVSANSDESILGPHSIDMAEGRTVLRAPSNLSEEDVFSNIEEVTVGKASFFDQVAQKQSRFSMCSPCHATVKRAGRANKTVRQADKLPPSAVPGTTFEDVHKTTLLPSMMDQSVSSVSSHEISVGSQMDESVFLVGQHDDEGSSWQDDLPTIQCHYVGFLGQFKLDISGKE